MTEQEWLKCTDSSPMLDSLVERSDATDRKLRLFAVASCRRIWPLLIDSRSRMAVDEAEQLADDSAHYFERVFRDAQDAEENARLQEDTSGYRIHQIDLPGSVKVYAAQAARETLLPCAGDPYELCWWCNTHAASAKATAGICELLRDGHDHRLANSNFRRFKEEELAAQSVLVRDIFGNPFSPVTLDPRWRSSTVVDLATAIYDERAFDRMPILGDALMDAGCDSDDMILHCRGKGPHVRGCWVVDLILGKS